jgi:hypothetical protein
MTKQASCQEIKVNEFKDLELFGAWRLESL